MPAAAHIWCKYFVRCMSSETPRDIFFLATIEIGHGFHHVKGLVTSDVPIERHWLILFDLKVICSI